MGDHEPTGPRRRRVGPAAAATSGDGVGTTAAAAAAGPAIASLLAGLPWPALVLDAGLRVRAGSPGAAGLPGLGEPDDRPLPERLRERWPRPAADAVAACLRDARARGGPSETDELEIPPDRGGGPLSLVLRAVPLALGDGGNGGVDLLCCLLDRTVTSGLERRLRHSEDGRLRTWRLFGALFDRLPVMLVLWDPNVERLTLNARAEATLGWTTEEANCGDFMARVYPDPEYRARVMGFMQSLESGWREFRATVRDGSTIPTEWANVRLDDDTVIGIGVDLRERMRAERALREARDELEDRVAKRTEELQRQKGQLRRLARELASAESRERKRLAALLHDDLQQHLVALKMRIGLARQQSRPERLEEALGEAVSMIDGALQASRSLTYELRPPVLYEDGLVPALRWLAGDMECRHRLRVHVEAGPCPTPVGEDLRAMLFQAVRELLFNAVKHAAVQEATVTVEDDGTRLRIAVRDRGAGFDAEEAALRPRTAGGLGLFSIRERLQSAGGTMDLRTARGAGTEVVLDIPITETAAPVAADVGTESRVAAPPSPRERADAGVPTVLVVDDHAVVRQGLVTLIADDERVRVAGEAGDGMEALEAVARLAPELVLMDVNMPRMNGIEATRRIRRRWPDVRVVGLSVQDDPAIRRSMLDAGAAGFVSKSDDAEAMVRAMLGAVADG